MSEFFLDLKSLRDAIKSLEDSLDVVEAPNWFELQHPRVQNTILAGVIQNFEFVYEISVKMIRRRLEMDSLEPTGVDSQDFRTLLRNAGETGLVGAPESWFKYRTMRNITAHTNDHEKARQVYQETLVFIADARALLVELEARNG